MSASGSDRGSGGTHPSDLVWSRHLGGTLGALERWRLRRHLRTCERCRAQELELLAQKATFDAAPGRAREIAALTAGLPRAAVAPRPARRPALAWGAGFSLAAAGAAAALLLVLVAEPPGDDEGLRPKGESVFSLFVKRGDRVVPFSDRCRAGDQIRARLRSERRFLVIAGVDSSGTLEVLYPKDAARPAGTPPWELETPGSWVLDDAAGEQRFIAVFSDAPIDLAALRPALLEGRPAPAGVEILERRCLKERQWQ